MSGVNKVILVGRVGKDPELRNAGNASVVNFSIATSESWKDKTTGEKKETTEWTNLVMWRALADVAAKYVKKGDMIYVEGKLTTRKWEKDGVTRYTTEVVVNNMVMLGSKQAPTAGSVPTGPSPGEDAYEDLPKTDLGGDELPF